MTGSTARNMDNYYQRQIRLPQIGPMGQERLGNARVLIVGLGALGCPAAEYLARAGVGELFLMDGDSIAIHNLHRQPLYTPAQAGRSKAEVAAKQLSESNPLIQVHPIPRFFPTSEVSAGNGNPPANQRAAEISLSTGEGTELTGPTGSDAETAATKSPGGRMATHRTAEIPVPSGGTELDTPPTPGLDHQQKAMGNWQNSPGKEPADKAWAGARASGVAASAGASGVAASAGASGLAASDTGTELTQQIKHIRAPMPPHAMGTELAGGVGHPASETGTELAGLAGASWELQLVAGVDLVLDCTDRFSSRFAIHDACQGAGVRLVSAAVTGFTGQLQVYHFDSTPGPCLRCLYPQGLIDGCTGSCAQDGILGAAAGIMGSLQALTSLQYLLGLEVPDMGVTTTINLQSFERHTMHWPQAPDCPGCGTLYKMGKKELNAATHHVPSTDPPANLESIGAEPSISPNHQGVRIPPNPIVIDLREPEEIQPEDSWFFPNAVNIPTSRITQEVSQLDRGQGYLLVCEHGQRSQSVLGYLKEQGFNQVSHLEQGFAGLRGKIRRGGR